MDPAIVRGDSSYREFVSQSADGVWCLELGRPIPVGLPATETADLIVRVGRVTRANDAAGAMLGRHRGYELIGRRLPGLLVHDSGQLRKVLTDFVAGGYRLSERRLPLESGSDDGALIHSLTGIVQDGALVRIWGVQRPAADWRATAEPLHHAQKMAAVGHLAGGVAHDFNNFLTAILGYGEMVNDSLESGSPSHADMQQVLSAARKAEKLTRQLLTFSRRQHRGPEPFDLNVAVIEFEPLLRRLMPEEIEITVRCAETPALIRGDRGQLELAIMNLVLNARDAMPHGGRIALAVAVGLGDGGAGSAPSVRLTVSDTGAGIAPEIRTRILEPFFTTKPGAPGLGLTTVHAIVTQNGGRLEIGSDQPRGAAFTLVLTGLPVEVEPARATTVVVIQRMQVAKHQPMSARL